MNLAQASPRDAIIDSWRLPLRTCSVEDRQEAKATISHPVPINVPYALGAAWFLHFRSLIPDSVMAAIQNLSAIHAKVIDNPDFQPDTIDGCAGSSFLYSASVREDLEKIS